MALAAQFGGGRAGESAAYGITEDLVKAGFESGRMKTGTPPRVDGRSLDYSKMIDLHDRLIAQNPPHSSPMEHCCLCVTEDEYNNSFKGQEKGWFRNYKGFKSYRQVIEESK